MEAAIKKAPARRSASSGSILSASNASITSFFRPLSKTTCIDLVDQSSVTSTPMMDLTAIEQGQEGHEQAESDAKVEAEGEEEKEEAAEAIDPQRQTRQHPFFTQFSKTPSADQAFGTSDEHVQREETIRNLLRRAPSTAPLFPAFLGSISLTNNGSATLGSAVTRHCFGRKHSSRAGTPVSIMPSQGCWRGFGHSSPLFSSNSKEICPTKPMIKEQNRGPIEGVFDAIVESLDEPTKKKRKSRSSDSEEFFLMDDSWLPQSLGGLSSLGSNGLEKRKKKEATQKHRHMHLICGPCGIGKSFLARRLASHLDLELIELSTSAAQRTTKSLEDLLVKSAHHTLSKEDRVERRFVVLIDEIDVVFEGDRPFLAGLTSYLSKCPATQIVVMTANAPVKLLERYYSFPADLNIHQMDGVDLRQALLSHQFWGDLDRPVPPASSTRVAKDCTWLDEIELNSSWDCHRTHQPTKASFDSTIGGHECSIFAVSALGIVEECSTVVTNDGCPMLVNAPYALLLRRAYLEYLGSLAGRRLASTACISEDWATDILPMWRRLEGLQAEHEKKRRLAARRSRPIILQHGYERTGLLATNPHVKCVSTNTIRSLLTIPPW